MALRADIAGMIEAEAAQMLLTARIMCRAERDAGVGPCACGSDLTRCVALDVYGAEAREIQLGGGRSDGRRWIDPEKDKLAARIAREGGIAV